MGKRSRAAAAAVAAAATSTKPVPAGKTLHAGLALGSWAANASCTAPTPRRSQLNLAMLPDDIIYELLIHSLAPCLAECSRSLAASLLPAAHVPSAIKARYLLALAQEQYRVAQVAKAEKRALKKQKKESSKKKTTDNENDTDKDVELAGSALVQAAFELGFKYPVLDLGTLRHLDAKLVRCTGRVDAKVVVPAGKKCSVPRWLVTLVVAEPAPDGPRFMLMQQLFDRGMAEDKGFALLKAVQQGCVPVLEELITRGFDVNVREGKAGEVAVRNRRLDVLQLLLRSGYRPVESALTEALAAYVADQTQPADASPPVETTDLSRKRARDSSPTDAMSTKRARGLPTPSTSPTRSSTAPTVRDPYTSLFLASNCPVRDAALISAVKAYPQVLTRAEVTLLLATAQKQGHVPGSKVMSSAYSRGKAAAAPEAVQRQADLVPLLLEHGAVPDMALLQKSMQFEF
ncbi:hypothetical protein AMAG_09304 [Allomyces macrogynus ATCC 38327]|uniref:Uncharacterized protein n=1 Tax=Allomyces macrogynus (strain ATCC 38327) TaxID=578462 RepID=A0A0L0SP54_ALLM3|nr:hypothetical protein AMAG_09304 [Allomyces macrogynus ATCC 38327]|eukprot:KNE64272.1 hypothetical protein AMAG_09304 [Allomyces macrogynus ATCC 38327]